MTYYNGWVYLCSTYVEYTKWLVHTICTLYVYHCPSTIITIRDVIMMSSSHGFDVILGVRDPMYQQNLNRGLMSRVNPVSRSSATRQCSFSDSVWLRRQYKYILANNKVLTGEHVRSIMRLVVRFTCWYYLLAGFCCCCASSLLQLPITKARRMFLNHPFISICALSVISLYIAPRCLIVYSYIFINYLSFFISKTLQTRDCWPQ